jgi:hypothetical protein
VRIAPCGSRIDSALSRTISISFEDRNVRKGSQILGVFDARTDDVREPAEEVSGRGRELVTTNKSTVMTKSLLDPVVVENGQGDGGLANSTSTNEGDWNEVLSEIDYLLDQLVASKEGS